MISLLKDHFLIFIAVIFVINLITFLAYGLDKMKAKRGWWRISEKALLTSAFVMGGIGAFLGMKVFHHKTKHWYFAVFVPLFAVIQIVLFILITYKCIVT